MNKRHINYLKKIITPIQRELIRYKGFFQIQVLVSTLEVNEKEKAIDGTAFLLNNRTGEHVETMHFRLFNTDLPQDTKNFKQVEKYLALYMASMT